MLGKLVCNSAGSDSTSWYSATPMHLFANEDKSCAQLQQEIGDMPHQSSFYLSFMRISAEAKKVETVGVFQRFTGQVGLRFRQKAFKIAHGLAAALQ